MRMRTVTFQLIGYHGDDLATGSQTAVLRRTVCAPGIAGYQHISLQGGLPANLFGKFQILRLQIPAAHQGDRRFLQQLLVTPKPQTPRRIQPQPVMDRLRIRFRHPAEDPALLPRAPLQVMLQKDHILQKSDDGYAYYYEDDCILCAKNDWQGNGEVTYEEWFTAEELSAFKARNDWDQLIREEKCTKKAVLSRKPGEKLNLEKKDFEKATKDWLTNNGFPIKSDKRIYTTKVFFMADDYGREIYCIYVNETCLDATNDEQIVLAVMFMPDGTCDPTVSVIRIDDMKNYRDQMKAFRQSNGWDTEYKAE